MTGREKVLQKLDAAGLLHQRLTVRVALCRAVKFLLLAVAVFFALDVWLHLEGRVRLLLSLSLIAAIAALLGGSCIVTKLRRRRAERIARILEERDSALGSSLINLLQLEEQTRDGTLTPLTRELAGRAMNEYAERLADVDFAHLARLPHLKNEYMKAAWSVGGFAALLLLFHNVALVEVPRFLMPYGDHPPFSLTKLSIVDPVQDGSEVVFNEGLLVSAAYTGHRPRDLYLTAFDPADPDGSRVTLPMFARGKEGFIQRLDNIRSDLMVYAHTRNEKAISRQRAIRVVLTPRAEQAFVTVEPPAYTLLEPRESSYHFKDVRALAGSDVSFRVRSNRPLDHGRIAFEGSNGGTQEVRMDRIEETEVRGGLAAEESGRVRFYLHDVNQLQSTDAYAGSLTVVYDLPPDVRILEPGQNAFVVENHRLNLRVEASDDYGVRQIRVHRGLNGVFSPPKVFSVQGAGRREEVRVPLPLPDLGVAPGDLISIYAEAIDNRPDPQMGKSQVVHLTVITEEEYNSSLLRQSEISQIWGKYNQLADRLREMVEAQEELVREMEALREEIAATDDPVLKEELAAKLEGMVRQQQGLNEQLATLADDMETFVRENPLYDIEQEFGQRLARGAQAIRESLGEQETAIHALAEAGEAGGLSSGAAADGLSRLRDAGEKLARSVREAERETREEILAAIEELARMQALVLEFHRFRILYQQQTALVEQARPYNVPSNLSREERLSLNHLAAEEREIGRGIGEVVTRLREKATQAEEMFPKAAASANDLADRIEQKRLTTIAERSSQVMLTGRGAQAFEAAERLRQEMSQFFGDDEDSFGGPPPGMDISEMGHEMDRYLSLRRGMECGNTFGQMCLSQNFGTRPGTGPGTGWGMAGFMATGSTVASAAPMQMLGAEAFLTQGAQAAMPSPPGQGNGQQTDWREILEAQEAAGSFAADTTPQNSGAVASDNLIDEYQDVVDAYFIKITE